MARFELVIDIDDEKAIALFGQTMSEDGMRIGIEASLGHLGASVESVETVTQRVQLQSTGWFGTVVKVELKPVAGGSTIAFEKVYTVEWDDNSQTKHKQVELSFS